MSDKQATEVTYDDDYYGNCPECGKNNGYINYGRDHYFLCHEHKTIWWIGNNLFSSWQEEDETIWEERRRRYGDYQDVTYKGAPKDNPEDNQPKCPPLGIHLNEHAMCEFCAVCSKNIKLELGPELFTAETNKPVCYDCARKHAPELVDCLWEYRQRLLEADVRPDSLAVDDDNLSLPF
jgi:hypothetical protein